MESAFVPHEITWTREKSSRFWAYFSSNRASENRYFSKQVGDSLIDYVQQNIDLTGNILDFGCGHGFFIEKLLSRNIPCEGLDFSIEAAQTVKTRLSGSDNFRGVTVAGKIPTPFDDNKFDVIFLVETIEHLLREELVENLKEIYRITRRGGYVVVTTPNEENLEANKIICPECGCIFHRIQHVNSWTKTKLSSFMENIGFRQIVCEATVFRTTSRLNTLKSRLGILRNMWAKARDEKYPHLLYIGEKCKERD